MASLVKIEIHGMPTGAMHGTGFAMYILISVL